MNFEFMTIDTPLPPCMPFPRALTGFPVEKETIVLFNEGEDKANIYTHNAGLKKRLAAFAKKYPDLCRLEKSNVQGGVSYELAKSRLSIRFLPPYSEERRQKASEYAKKHGLNSQQG